MIILGVKARNFRSYQQLEALLTERTLIIGPNGAGKSTIVDAICYALTGACRGTDEGGKGSDNLLGFHWLNEDGAAPPITAAVEVATDKATFRRAVGDGPNSKIGADIKERLGYRIDALRAVFRPGSFLSLSKQDQAGLWSTLSAPADIGPIALEHLKGLVDPATVPKTMKQLETWSAALLTKRPELKRAIAEVERSSSVDLSGFDSRLVAMSPEDLEATKLGLQDRVKQMRQERDKTLLDRKPAAPERRIVSKNEETLREYEAMLKDFPGTKARCPHCQKGIVLLEGSKEVQTLESAREAEKTLRLLIEQTKEAMAKETKREPVQQPLAAAPPADTASLDEKIDKATKVIGDIDRLLFIRQQAGSKAGRATALKDELARLERTIEIVAPRGPLRAALTSQGESKGFDLLNSVNRVLKAMKRPEAWVSVSPWIMTLGNVPVVCLSDSQRLALNIAIQAGIAEATGIRVLVVDAIETFESSSRRALSQAIRDCAPFVDQVILLGAKSAEELAEAQAPPGWKLLRVQQNGHGVSEVVV